MFKKKHWQVIHGQFLGIAVYFRNLAPAAPLGPFSSGFLNLGC